MIILPQIIPLILGLLIPTIKIDHRIEVVPIPAANVPEKPVEKIDAKAANDKKQKLSIQVGKNTPKEEADAIRKAIQEAFNRRVKELEDEKKRKKQ